MWIMESNLYVFTTHEIVLKKSCQIAIKSWSKAYSWEIVRCQNEYNLKKDQSHCLQSDDHPLLCEKPITNFCFVNIGKQNSTVNVVCEDRQLRICKRTLTARTNLSSLHSESKYSLLYFVCTEKTINLQRTVTGLHKTENGRERHSARTDRQDAITPWWQSKYN